MTGEGLTELKDVLWKAINDDANRIEAVPITHRPLDGHHRVREEDEFIFNPEPIAPDAEAEYDEEDDNFDPDLDYDWDGEE